MFKSATQPHCIYCGAKIRKWTNNKYISMRDRKHRTLADVQRDNNEKVVHIRYWQPPDEERYVSDYSTWDGESYVDEFFCNGDHAKRFAYKLARKHFTK